MKKKEKQGLLILILVAALIISVIWFITRGNEEEETRNPLVGTGTTSSEYVKEENDGTKVEVIVPINNKEEK